MHLTENGDHVMLAMAFQRDIAQHDHIVIAFNILKSASQHFFRVFLVTGKKLGIGINNALGRINKPFAIRIVTGP